jgi:outer membrane protein assembly factor BamB
MFVYGSHFELFCLNSETGNLIWKRDILNEFNGDMIKWQNAMSPIVMKDRVLVSGGGKGQAFLAFNKEDGSLLWKSGTGTVGHVTPVLSKIDDVEQALFMIRGELISLDPQTGKELWTYPFKFGTSMAASPVVWVNMIHVTAGYGIGGACIEVTKAGGSWKVDELWRIRGNSRAASIWSTPVAHEGYLYGFYSHKEYGSGAFKCLEMRTGKVMWQQDGFGLGQLIMAGEKLFALTDFGRLHVIAPSSDEYTEIASTEIIDGKCWATPVISDGQIFIRSTTAGVCYDL